MGDVNMNADTDRSAQARSESIGVSGSGKRPNVKVLMYHKIVPDGTPPGKYSWTSTISQLKKHLALLSRWGYKAISLRDYSACLQGTMDLPDKPVIMTFDDGYEDVRSHALPVLDEFGAKATFFVLGDRALRTNRWDAKIGVGRSELLSDEGIRELHAHGHEIGSHSMTHPDLTTMSAEGARREIFDSKKKLEDVIQSRVSSFSYPHGATNPALKKTVENSGYAYGCGVYSGPPRFGRDNFNVRRLPVTQHTNEIILGLMMLAPYEYYAWLRWKAGRKVPSSFRGRNGSI